MSRATEPSLMRWLYRHLWSGRRQTIGEVVAAQRDAVLRAGTLVRAFYVISLFIAAQSMNGWDRLLALPSINPLWPASWHGLVGDGTAMRIILYGYLLSALCAAVWPERRLARAAYPLFLLQYSALINSLGKIGHGLASWLFVAFVLIALPNGRWSERRRIRERHYFLTVFWAAQVVVLFFYTLTGLWKVGYAVTNALTGDPNAFQVRGFADIVAKRLLDTNETSLLGDFFIRHERLGWLAFLVTMFLEGTSLLVAFRPRLHQLWGVGLIGFHFATELTMNIAFNENIALVGLLLVCSPFARGRLDLRAALGDVPGVFAIRRLLRRRKGRRRQLASA